MNAFAAAATLAFSLPDGFALSSIVERIGWMLVHFTWQGLLVAILLALTLRLMRRRSPAVRYGASCAAMLALVALPAVTVCLVSVERAAPAPLPEFRSAIVVTADTQLPPQVESPLPPAALTAPASAPATTSATMASLLTPLRAAIPWLVAAWAAGVALLAAWHAGGWARVRRLCRVEVRPLGERWDAIARDVAKRLGVRRAVRLLESARAAVPIVVGCLRPVILIPTSALTGLTVAELEAILAHELAHVRRHDYLVNLLQVAVETIFFYHPAVWWVSARVRAEREHCCDDLAAAVTAGGSVAYARALARLEELRMASDSLTTPPRLAPAAVTGSLLSRVRRLLGREERDAGMSRVRPIGAVAIAAVFLTAGTVGFLISTGALAGNETPLAGDRAADNGNRYKEGNFIRVTITGGNGAGVHSVLTRRISDNGTISLPFVPSIEAAGLTGSELEEKLVAAYRTTEVGDTAKFKVAFAPPGEPADEEAGEHGNAAIEERMRQADRLGDTLVSIERARVMEELSRHTQLLQRTRDELANAHEADKGELEQKVAAVEQRMAGLKEWIEEQSKEIERIRQERSQRLNAASANRGASNDPQDKAAEQRPFQPGDVIRMTFSDLEGPGVMTTVTRQVSETGSLKLPYVGAIKVAGQTRAQLEETIVKCYGPEGVNIIQRANVTADLAPAGTKPDADDPRDKPMRRDPGRVLRPGDAIRVTISERGTGKTLHVVTAILDDDGRFTLPDAGRVNAEGLTPEGLETTVSKAYAPAADKVLRDAAISVELLQLDATAAEIPGTGKPAAAATAPAGEVPVLSKIPYLSRLFRNVNAKEAEADPQVEAERQVERNPEVLELSRRLAESELQIAAALTQLGKENPKVQELIGQNDALQARLDLVRRQQRAAAMRDLAEQRQAAAEAAQRTTPAAADNADPDAAAVRPEGGGLDVELPLVTDRLATLNKALTDAEVELMRKRTEYATRNDKARAYQELLVVEGNARNLRQAYAQQQRLAADLAARRQPAPAAKPAVNAADPNQPAHALAERIDQLVGIAHLHRQLQDLDARLAKAKTVLTDTDPQMQVLIAERAELAARLEHARRQVADADARQNDPFARPGAEGGAAGEATLDDTFLRRIYLDLAGRLPTRQEARAFIEDDRPSRRERLVETLAEAAAPPAARRASDEDAEELQAASHKLAALNKALTDAEVALIQARVDLVTRGEKSKAQAELEVAEERVRQFAVAYEEQLARVKEFNARSRKRAEVDAAVRGAAPPRPGSYFISGVPKAGAVALGDRPVNLLQALVAAGLDPEKSRAMDVLLVREPGEGGGEETRDVIAVADIADRKAGKERTLKTGDVVLVRERAPGGGKAEAPAAGQGPTRAENPGAAAAGAPPVPPVPPGADPAVFGNYWENIARRGDPDARARAVNSLTEMLRTGSAPNRLTGLAVLARVADAPFNRAPFVPLVHDALKDDQPAVRAAALEALAAMRVTGPEHLSVVAPLAGDADDAVRERVAAALLAVAGEHPPQEVDGAVERLLADKSATVRRATVRALWGRPVSPAAEATLIEMSRANTEAGNEVVYYALSTRPMISPDVAKRLIEVMSSSFGHVYASRAAWGLSKHPAAPFARDTIVKALAAEIDRTLDPYTRRQCVEGLGLHGGEHAIVKLNALARSEDEDEKIKDAAKAGLRRLSQ